MMKGEDTVAYQLKGVWGEGQDQIQSRGTGVEREGERGGLVRVETCRRMLQ
jgi:hypothetical protein